MDGTGIVGIFLGKKLRYNCTAVVFEDNIADGKKVHLEKVFWLSFTCGGM